MVKDEGVHLVPYNLTWPLQFEEEKKLIKKTIGQWITGEINHVGSTAIPGISAKPIIDIMVGVESLEASKPCIERLSKINYLYYPYRPESMHWFLKPSPERRTHHLYLIPVSHPQYKARLEFRDYLRDHPKERQEYEELKRELAKKFRNDREGYTLAKTQFITDILFYLSERKRATTGFK